MTREQFAEMIAGLKPEDIYSLLAKYNFSIRVVQKEGKGCTVTCDYDPDRLDIVVKDGVIVKAE